MRSGSPSTGRRFPRHRVSSGRNQSGRTRSNKIKVILDLVGPPLTVWSDDPAKEDIYNETAEEVILLKDKSGRVIGCELLHSPSPHTPRANAPRLPPLLRGPMHHAQAPRRRRRLRVPTQWAGERSRLRCSHTRDGAAAQLPSGSPQSRHLRYLRAAARTASTWTRRARRGGSTTCASPERRETPRHARDRSEARR
jgi:hypothetical protein